MNFLRAISRERVKPKSQAEMMAKIDDTIRNHIERGRFLGEKVTFGPNFVHTYIMRGPSGELGAPGAIEDLGWNHNYRPNAGMDWIHGSMGGRLAAGVKTLGTATSTTANTWVKTAAGFTVNDYTGCRIVVPVTGLTTEPVYGNVLSNTATDILVDQWWKADDTTGTTPGNSAALLLPGFGPARFIGLTNDATAYSTGMTSLASEITANNCGRALATFAHSAAATTYTLAKTWTANGNQTVHRAGNFTGGYGSSGGGIMAAITDLNADATLASGDSLAVTWTWTLPAAGA